MIEDNTDEHVVYDPELTSSISIVRSVLNKVLGKIILPSLQEKNKMHHEITNVNKKNNINFHSFNLMVVLAII